MAENFADALYEYRYLWMRVAFRRQWGRVVMPLAGLAADGSALPPKIVQAESPYGFKVVQFRLEAYGRVPSAPSWDSPDPNDMILTDEVSYPVSMTDPGTSRHFWELAGEYVYALLQPIDPAGGLPGITMPTEIDGRSASANSIPGSAFTQVLIQAANTNVKTKP